MNDTGSKILEALFSIFDGEEKKAQANLTNYLNNAAGIGEHPDVVAEAKKLVEEIEHARHCREIVQSMK
jgi:hypothetical protein|tara:strand:+ start:351 stop:557 length:207 start_codon:yes stop_codon:yes gene_type:complete